MNNTAVLVRNLVKKFGAFTAVNGISFSVEKGEIFGFLGPNGAGKSTTIKMLCGLLTPTSGDGAVAGFDIINQSEQIKKNIGYMSQKFSLYDDLTVSENIDFFGGIYNVPLGKKLERKNYVLEMANLTAQKNDITKYLPSGFKQRLALGCAVQHCPPILFLDEPTSGVDPISRRNFWALIRSMSEEGVTVFVTTHYMDEAEFCNRLALINKGAIIADGAPSELKKKYMKKEILEIEADKLFDAMQILSKNNIENAVFANLIHATVDDAKKIAPEIKDILKNSGIKVNKIEKIPPSLEDVFVSLTDEN